MLFWKVGPEGKPVQATKDEAQRFFTDENRRIPLSSRVGNISISLAFNPLCQAFDGDNLPLCFEIATFDHTTEEITNGRKSSWLEDAMADFDNEVDRLRRRFPKEGDI